MADFKSKIGSWAVSLIESTVFGFVKKIKENTVDFLEELPDTSAKAFYGLCCLVFVIIVGATGLVLIPASVILIYIQYMGPETNKALVAGYAFFWLGLFYFSASVVLLLLIGKNIKVATEKATRKMVRKLGK